MTPLREIVITTIGGIICIAVKDEVSDVEAQVDSTIVDAVKNGEKIIFIGAYRIVASHISSWHIRKYEPNPTKRLMEKQEKWFDTMLDGGTGRCGE